MCRALQVHCGCSPSAHHPNMMYTHGRTTHSFEMPLKYLVPCQVPGSGACKAGQGRSIKFQNPTTECAGKGVDKGLDPKEEKAREMCESSLAKYGEAVYKINRKNFAKSVKDYKKKHGGYFSGWF